MRLQGPNQRPWMKPTCGKGSAAAWDILEEVVGEHFFLRRSGASSCLCKSLHSMVFLPSATANSTNSSASAVHRTSQNQKVLWGWGMRSGLDITLRNLDYNRLPAQHYLRRSTELFQGPGVNKLGSSQKNTPDVAA